MPPISTRPVLVAIVCTALAMIRVASAADDVPAAAAVPRPPVGARAGIDLAAHVDINVVLPPNHWRVSGGLQNIVVAGGGRLVLEGNLTIGGEPVAEPVQRVRRADEAVMTKLRQAQRERLAALAANPLIPADRRRSLELATEVDIRRVMGHVARVRARYEGRSANLGDDAWREFQKDITLCRSAIADPFGEDSLLAAVRAGLDDDTGP